MGVGAGEFNNTIAKVKAMQSRWGIGQTGMSVGRGTRMEAGQINTVIDMINAGKSKSGWGGAVSGKVGGGSRISNILASLNSQADAITNHCPCNCNHCACNCNHCSCNCNDCFRCSSDCDRD